MKEIIRIGYLSLLILFMSCGSSKKVWDNLNYDLNENGVIVTKKDEKIKWPKKIYIFKGDNNKKVNSRITSDNFLCNYYIHPKGIWSYIEPKENDSSFYLKTYNPNHSVIHYFIGYTPDASLVYGVSKNCIEELENIVGNDLVNVFNIKNTGTINFNPKMTYYGEKSFNLYQSSMDYFSINFSKPNTYFDIKISFVDSKSEMPLNNEILIELQIKKTPNDRYNRIKNIDSNECFSNIKLSKIRKSFVYEADKWIKNIGELNYNTKESISKSRLNITDNFLNDFEIEVKAKSIGREPISFFIKGDLFNKSQKYIIKWPSLPVNIKIVNDDLKPEIIKLN